tara:strand:- start:109 stop:1368 length:1260 start_codon:yes stop_codon:yes gene_type:complete
MKKFSQFLSEAGETTVSAQARKQGLKGDGHGGWYDQQGKFKAKTVDGKLKIFSGREAKAEEDKQNKKKAAADNVKSAAKTPAATSAQQKKSIQQQQKQPTQAAPEAEAPMDEMESTGAVIVFGRFNPPTIGHEKLLKAAATQAKREGADLAIYPSRTQDKKKNPLDPKTKIGFMKTMFPDYQENIFDDNNAKTIFDVLSAKYQVGYKSVTIMVGQDRLAEFQGLAQKYNGSELYAFDEIKVVSAGARDPDADDISGMSASKLRAHAAENDFSAFSKGVPNKMTVIQKKEMFNAVRKSMSIKEELWQIAPKFDPESLRESYVKGKIFKIGDIVENLNTGLVGQVNRRGTNYIICVTEDGIMFKSWLRDIKEYTEVKMDSMMRDKKHTNTLVGTTGFLKYVQSMTPGAMLNKRYVVKVGKK